MEAVGDMLEEMGQSLKRDFWNGPAGEREYFEGLRLIRGAKM